MSGTGSSAGYVAAGILLSRIAGLLRERIFAQYFGTSLYASAFRAALKLPNVLQNLLGEGTLSASFIPVYAQLLERGDRQAAGRLAGAIFGLLLAVSAAIVIIGELLAPVLVELSLWGATDALKQATIPLVRIALPMAGVLVLSAWALGILNSHRRFFLPYVAPVLWNAAMIATLLFLGERLEQSELVRALAWGALAGGFLQFLVQLPRVLQLERELRIGWDTRSTHVRQVVRNAAPAIAGRGVVQISGYLDIFLAGFLFEGAIAALNYAQTIYILPVSLFGMSIAAAELPEMARQGEQGDELRKRLQAGLRRVAFLVIPSAIAFLVLGDIIVAALYRTGRFGASDSALVQLVLAGYTVGLVASTSSRLNASALYALHDTRTPARIAFVRVVVSTLLGVVGMLILERWSVRGDPFAISTSAALAPDARPLGALGLSAAAGIAAWVEWLLLRRAVLRRLGTEQLFAGVFMRLLFSALPAALVARGIDMALPPMAPIPRALLVLPVFGLCYLGIARALGIDEGSRLVRRLRRRGA